ncbi:MAG: acyl-CoA dehydrogenase family protein [Actinomycetia bacterium]|jgi:alkylation response protein AidB-like acyl-CoA dehydrogenase|nr:acyl-CoA dehydrogenase family protein [Actinomycetes bacterium]
MSAPSPGLDRETLEFTLDAVREFAARHLPAERLLELDHLDECPVDTVRQMCGDELGIQLVFIPEEFGGMGGSAFDVYRVCEAMAAIDLGVATSVLATFLGTDPITVGATDEQKARWLGEVAEQGALYAYGATEPEAGSDLGSLRTKATPVEQDGEVVGYRISGRKQWISNGGIADAYTILANAPGGPTWFVVRRGADGFTQAKPEDKHGIRLSNTAALYLDDVEVGTEDLVGVEEGQGLWQAQQVFGYTRLNVAAFGLGAGWAALDRAITYSTTRIQAGGPLSEKQGYTHKLLVPHAVRLEAARAYIEETAERLDAGEGSLNTEGAIAKYLATEAGNAAAEASIQAFGGYGYTREYLVEKIKRDVRITTIYEGTSEIMEMTIARDRWQQHLKTQGGYYHDQAAELERLHATSPGVGADVAALGLHALAGLMEWCRVGRLTRSQHVLFRLGELVSYAEGAAALARRAARAAAGTLSEKTDPGFDATGLATLSRLFAREAAERVATRGLRLVLGAGGADPSQLAQLTAGLRLAEIQAAQHGQLADMDAAVAPVYRRAELASHS